MALYHETAQILSRLAASDDANLRTLVFSDKTGLKSPPSQIYALAVETFKWSRLLSDVVDRAELLYRERKLTATLALLLVHDFLVAKGGIALPASHGLRQAIDRHKARLSAEFTRVRIRRGAATLDELRAQVEQVSRSEEARYPRWIRVNTLKTTLDQQLATTFAGFPRCDGIAQLMEAGPRHLYRDEHIPNLVAVSPNTDVLATDAYQRGDIILQDKASCFPAYLLDARIEEGDVIDTCSAPGNKTTHVAAILREKLTMMMTSPPPDEKPKVYAWEKSPLRAKTLASMLAKAGAAHDVTVYAGQDFLQVDPRDSRYATVGALLLDPSCSGSGIVHRDAAATLHLPKSLPGKLSASKPQPPSHKKTSTAKTTTSDKQYKSGGLKRDFEAAGLSSAPPTLLDDDGLPVATSSEQDLEARLRSLSTFQRKLLLHAMAFPGARRITYSTCSVHARENEEVVVHALASDVAQQRGWRLVRRAEQVDGMQRWPVRGDPEAVAGDADIADACVRSYKGDGRGVMGFFVAAFVREDVEERDEKVGGVEPSPPNGRTAKRASERGGEMDSESESERDVKGTRGDSDESSGDEWGGFED